MPFEKITVVKTPEITGCCAVTVLERQSEVTHLEAQVFLDGKSAKYSGSVSNSAADYQNDCERLLAVQLFYCFTEITGYQPPWGILTGIRPVKLFSRLAKQLGESGAERYFAEQLKVTQSKISLCRQTMAREQKIISLSRRDSFSLYISVPFCPTRCSYCSFVSHSVGQAKNLIPQYVNLLCEELKITAQIAAKCGLTLETVYIGGGTPTTLSAEQLDTIMAAVKNNFDLGRLREYTVEAGRPDTITRERLMVIKRNGASRISINPQTMNDGVLKAVGRAHTSEQTVSAFRLARECGFDNINMDLIAGLPTDTFSGFCNSLNRVIALNPESVTMHALAMKRASSLSVKGDLPPENAGPQADSMVAYARERLCEAGIKPYYMYRQSKTVGNLENVGYAKDGAECLYNVYIMDETHTILACGASAVTKLRRPGGNEIQRIFNFKYPYEYISRFSEQTARKEEILRFYEKYPAVY